MNRTFCCLILREGNNRQGNKTACVTIGTPTHTRGDTLYVECDCEGVQYFKRNILKDLVQNAHGSSVHASVTDREMK